MEGIISMFRYFVTQYIDISLLSLITGTHVSSIPISGIRRFYILEHAFLTNNHIDVNII